MVEELVIDVVWGRAAGANDAHTKRFAQSRDVASDAASSNDAQGLLGDGQRAVVAMIETLVRGAAFSEMLAGTMAQKRPVLPPPHQVAIEMWETSFGARKLWGPRSLFYHGWVTLSATLLGFAFGTTLGIALAVGIVHSRAMDMSVMPWIIASQTVPILAIAPMIIVVLNAVGLSAVF